MTKRDARLLLENVRSVHNVGSIFRTVETLGISKMYRVNVSVSAGIFLYRLLDQ